MFFLYIDQFMCLSSSEGHKAKPSTARMPPFLPHRATCVHTPAPSPTPRTSCFSYGSDKYLREAVEGRRGLFGLTVSEDTVHHRGGMVAEASLCVVTGACDCSFSHHS